MEPAGILLLIVFPIGPLALGISAWRRVRSRAGVAPTSPVQAWPGILNASLYLALTFNLVYFVQEFFLAWPKALLPGVEAVVYHNNHGWSGNHPDVVLYQGAGALSIIILGFVLTLFAFISRRSLREWHPLLWWTACMALGHGLIQVSIAAKHPDNDVGQAFDFLALSTGIRNLLALGSTTTAIAFGIYFARPLLAMAPEGSIGSARARVFWCLKFAILPLILGSIISWANRAPPVGHLTLLFFSGLFILPWTLAAAALTPPPKAVTSRLHRGIDWPLVLGSLLVLAFFRLVLANGLNV